MLNVDFGLHQGFQNRILVSLGAIISKRAIGEAPSQLTLDNLEKVSQVKLSVILKTATYTRYGSFLISFLKGAIATLISSLKGQNFFWKTLIYIKKSVIVMYSESLTLRINNNF